MFLKNFPDLTEMYMIDNELQLWVEIEKHTDIHKITHFSEQFLCECFTPLFFREVFAFY